MSHFFPDSVETRIERAATRTWDNAKNTCEWALKNESNKMKSAFVIAVVAVAFTFNPLYTVLALAIGALALFALNAATESSLFEQAWSLNPFS